MALPSLCSSSLLVDGSSSTTVGSNLVGTDMTEKSDALLVSDEEVVSVVLVLRRLLAKPLDSCEGSIIVLLLLLLFCVFIEGGSAVVSVKSSWDAPSFPLCCGM